MVSLDSLIDKTIFHKPVFRICLIAAILIGSFLLNSYNNDFPIFYHPDELRKVTGVIDNTQNFKHPILMLTIPRIINAFQEHEDRTSVLMLGRTTTAIYGTLLVLVFFMIARRFLKPPYDLLSMLALASSPIMVIHSHYFKEDIILVLCSLLSLVSFFHFAKKPSRGRTLLLGAAMGLAWSSKYIGVLNILVFYIGVRLKDGDDREKLFRGLKQAIWAALAVFLLVNFPIFIKLPTFLSGLSYELGHMVRGHQLFINPIDFLFSFHFFKSIVPGATPIVASLSILSFWYLTFIRANFAWEETTWLLFTIIFYVAVEVSPMKAHPGYMRYVLPVVPGLIYFLFKGFEQAMDRLTSRGLRLAAIVCMAISIVVPLQMSLRLDYYLIRDTRDRAVRYVTATGKKAKFEQYTGGNVKSLIFKYDLNDLKKEGYSYVVVGSFHYGRYQYGVTLNHQNEKIFERNRAYQNLFRYPYVEIKPDYLSFAFSNPTIRIIDISAPETPD